MISTRSRIQLLGAMLIVIVLGQKFLWSDLLCVAVGGALAALLDAKLSP